MQTAHTLSAECGVRSLPSAECGVRSAECGKRVPTRPSTLNPQLSTNSAITLIELLVVVSIIGLVTAMSLPAIKGIGQSNTIAAASRQLVDDIALARQMAINNRSTVRMMFMGPALQSELAPLTPPELATNLLKQQYTGYILYAERTIGDQPGQAFPRYLTTWRTLPDGIFIAPTMFSSDNKVEVNGRTYDTREFDRKTSPYPRGDSSYQLLFHCITFEPSGQLSFLRPPPQGVFVIPLARGSIFLEQGANGGYLLTPANPYERPRDNWKDNPVLIVIDAATGRARLEQPELQ